MPIVVVVIKGACVDDGVDGRFVRTVGARVLSGIGVGGVVVGAGRVATCVTPVPQAARKHTRTPIITTVLRMPAASRDVAPIPSPLAAFVPDLCRSFTRDSAASRDAHAPSSWLSFSPGDRVLNLSARGLIAWRRRRRHALSTNWDARVRVMLLRHELRLAEEAGIPPNEQRAQADEVWQTVTAELGWAAVVQTFIDIDYSTRTETEYALRSRFGGTNAAAEYLLNRTLDESGYNRVRAERFPPAS